MKRLYTICSLAMLVLLLSIGLYSLLDKDATYSESEKRKLQTRPKLTLSSLLDGSYCENFGAFYDDTFPSREAYLSANRKLNGFYSFSIGGKDSASFIMTGKNNSADHGEQLKPTDNSDASAPSEPASDTPQESTEPSEPQESTPQDPNHDASLDPDTERYGTIVLVGDRAMELAYTDYDLFDKYAASVSNISKALAANGVTTYSMLVPNATAFYADEEYRTGSYDQKNAIEYCYSKMDASVKTVDSYSRLSAHTDEYIYFRTDHHWTQLGAYYAYQQFCKAAGFESVALEQFQTGVYENFVGSMYTFTKGYPQSQTLYDNPDTLTYYLPIYETHAKYYADSTLQNGVPVSVVYTQLPESTSNKYLCYIGGDTPVCVIESAAEGGACIVLKESYGNAFVPFLTSHYSKIIVIDPREFNRDGKPSMDLTAFAKEQEIDDLIVINYPYMINNTAYISWLIRLVGADS